MILKQASHAILTILLCIGISGCRKDPNPEAKGMIEIEFMPSMDGKPFQVNQIFKGPNGKRMKVEDFRFYISDILLRGESEITARKDIALIDFSKGKNSIMISGPTGTYHQLSLGIGVNQQMNGINNPDFNPASYPINHPLSVYNSMYWTKETGYVFLRIEGKIDTSKTQDKTPDYAWFYHVGTDELYNFFTADNFQIRVEDGNTRIIRLDIEVNDLFRNNQDTINMVKEPFTHTVNQFDLAKRVIGNMRKNIRVIEN